MHFSPRRGVIRARILTSAEIKHAIRCAELTRDPERNTLLILITHACGLRVTECACIPLKAILYPSGRIREELTLDGSYTKYNRTRTVPLSSPRLLGTLDAYLDYRVRAGVGVIAGETAFRGLSPELALILSGRGSRFALARKKRVLKGGETEIYLACDALERVFATLYAQAGLHGASSHSGRRGFATKLLAQEADIATISHLLGQSNTLVHTLSRARTPLDTPSRLRYD